MMRHLRSIRGFVWFGCTKRTTRAALFDCLAILETAAIAGEPYLPVADDAVLEKLPVSLLAGNDDLASLRRSLAKAPTNEKLAIQVAQQFVRIGDLEGDPRFFGYAQSALKPWWDLASPTPTILRIRAKLKEKDHRYDEALADLKSLLDRAPHDAQAWLEVANIQRVKGNYAEAWKACDALQQFAGRVPTTICRAPLLAATGKTEQAYELLTDVLPSAEQEFPTVVSWIRTMQAQLSQAMGQNRLAEQHFREGLGTNPQNNYLRRSFADLLLDTDRPQEAFHLLRDHIKDNGILLRATIAAMRIGHSDLAEEWRTQLESRFEETRLRGGQPHGRFEARFELEVKDNPRQALSVALANWRKQKEQRDTRNVLEAAVRAQDSAAAQPVIEFLHRHKTKDVVLQKLVGKLVSKP